MMKKRIGTGLIVLFVAGLVRAAEPIPESVKQSIAESVQKVVEQSSEIKKLSDDVRKEKDPVARETLMNDLRAAFAGYSDEIDAADQKRLEAFDAHRAGLVQKMAAARIERQKRIETFIRTLAASDQTAAK